MRDIFIV